jgi:alcohol dehydrogenase class IV
MPEFRLPGVIHFGWGALERLAEEASRLGRRALVVTGRFAMVETGVGSRVDLLLTGAGVKAIHFSGV